MPSTVKMAASLAKALAQYAADGFGKASPEELRERLEICSDCEIRQDKRCGKCGCFIAPKAAMRSQYCPVGKWRDLKQRPLLTIGMATYDDFDGCWATIQSLRLHQSMHDVEIVVIDNHPTGHHAEHVKKLVKGARHGTAGTKYVEMPSPVGNAAAKNRIFGAARGEWVLVIDCHVMLPVGAIAKLKKLIRSRIDSRDLYQGPNITGDQFAAQSHWDDVWRGEMWGTWARDPRAADPGGEPFEIGGMGGGLFACRRDAWLGFHPQMRGFGGESMYIQRKYRQHGRKVWCLPFLRWLHRYPRPNGIPFPILRADKITNYMLGMIELDDHESLAEMRKHFRSVSEDQWQSLLSDAQSRHSRYLRDLQSAA